ncbi:MAG: phasin family protein [Janthinobacterium lividum]
MSAWTPEQLVDAQKTNLGKWFGFSSKAFESFEKLVALNMQVVKSSMLESQQVAQQAMSVRDPQELFALQASMSQPLVEKMLAYNRHLYDIAAGTQAEFASATETALEEQNLKLQALVENISRNAPAGSETAVAVVKSAMNAANTAYATIQKASKQAMEAAQNNMDAASAAASKAAQQASAQVVARAAAASEGA